MTLHQYGISVFFSQTSFPGEKVGWSQNAGCFLRLSWALRHLTTNVARRFTNLWHIVLSWVENSNWEIENEWLIKCLTNIDWLIDHSIDQSIDGWMDEWMVGLIYWLIDWLIDWVSDLEWTIILAVSLEKDLSIAQQCTLIEFWFSSG